MRNPWYKGTEAKKKMDEKTAWRRHVNLVRTFFFFSLFHKPGSKHRDKAHLHGGDDHASVHDELTQSCGTFVAVPAVNHQEAPDVFELSDGEICSQRRLLSLLGWRHQDPTSIQNTCGVQCHFGII